MEELFLGLIQDTQELDHFPQDTQERDRCHQEEDLEQDLYLLEDQQEDLQPILQGQGAEVEEH